MARATKKTLILKVGPALIIAAHFCIAKLLFRAAAFAKCIFYQLSENPKEVCKWEPFFICWFIINSHCSKLNFSVERWDLHFVTVIWDTSNINFCSLLLKETTASQLHFSRVGKIHPKILMSLLSVSSSFVSVCVHNDMRNFKPKGSGQLLKFFIHRCRYLSATKRTRGTCTKDTRNSRRGTKKENWRTETTCKLKTRSARASPIGRSTAECIQSIFALKRDSFPVIFWLAFVEKKSLVQKWDCRPK